MTRPTLRFALLALAVALQACGDAGESPTPACFDDSQCPPGEICFEDGCGSPLDFAVRVTPLKDSAHVVQDFNPVSVALSRMDLGLKAPGYIAGNLGIRSNGAVVDYPAYDASGTNPGRNFTIQARGRSGNIQGLEFEQAVTQVVRKGSAFALAVPAGVWDVSVVSSDLDLPPVFTQRIVAAGDTVDPQLALVGDNLREIEGRVVPEPGVPWPATPPAFRYQVLDPVRGTPLSQRSPLYSAADPFRVFALPISGAILLRATPDSAGPLAPTLEFRSDEDGKFSGFTAGDYGAALEVSGTVQDPLGKPIANAQVQLQGRVTGGGTLTVKRTTDASGRFTARVLASASPSGSTPPAEYEISVLPPPDSDFAHQSLRYAIQSSTTLPTIVCGPKQQLSGTVTGPDGDPLEGVLVHYEGNPSAVAPGLSRGDTKTNARGRFSALVEPGYYRVIAKPGPEHKLPWASRRLEMPVPATIDIVMSEAREVSGSVTHRNANGIVSVVASATVTLYRAPAGSSSPNPPPPVVIYETLTDSNGEFKVIVPRAQQSSPE